MYVYQGEIVCQHLFPLQSIAGKLKRCFISTHERAIHTYNNLIKSSTC